jgi:hypothetical protein
MWASIRPTDLPSPIAEAVRSARAEIGQLPKLGRPKPVIDDGELRQWIQEFSNSGDLAAAIIEVAAEDADLAG